MRPCPHAILLVLVLSACASAPSSTPAPDTPGSTKESAIEVCRPAGQRAYLSQLRCPDGNAPAFHRVGSVGERNPTPKGSPELDLMSIMNANRRLQPGEVDVHIVDRYELRCGAAVSTVFLDMYHCGQPAPQVAPAGFKLQQN